MIQEINEKLVQSLQLVEGEVVDHLKRNWKKYALAAGSAYAYNRYTGKNKDENIKHDVDYVKDIASKATGGVKQIAGEATKEKKKGFFS